MVIVKKTLLGLILWICCLANTHAEDIDLFASGLVNGASLGALPNIIFLLDNTSNWSQSLADGTKRGVAEAAAIKATLQGLDTDVNVAVLEFTTETGGGSSDNNGAFVRVALQPYQANASAIHVVLDTMVSDINAPVEKRNSNTEWGNLIYDVYNYLGGFDQSFAGAGTPSAIADSAGYDVNYSNFATPLDVAGLCAETYVIFISNPNSSGPRDDSADNSAALTQLYTDAGMAGAPNVLADGGPIGQQSGGLLMPTYSTGGAQTGLIGRSEGCYQNVAACDGNVNKNNPNPSESSVIESSCPFGSGNSAVDCTCDASSALSTNSNGAECPDETVGGGKNATQIPTFSYNVLGAQSGSGGTSYEASEVSTVDGAAYNLDDWAKYLKEFGVPVTLEDGTTASMKVTTYTVDVIDLTNPSGYDETTSSLLHSAAQEGGGYRLSASDTSSITAALNRIVSDIIDVNTSFAAVTLPLSATNRAQADNKVFVGMFRPAAERKPRWLGNLKRYQLAKFDSEIALADANLDRAINPQTGFAGACATSFWTSDTSDVDSGTAGDQPYFDGLGLVPNPTSECPSSLLDGRSVLSDQPDGPFVEKGGAAQQIRQQVDSSTDGPRTVLTLDGSSLRGVNSGGSTDISDTSVFDYLVGANAGLKGGDFKVDDGAGNYIANPDLADPEVMPAAGLRATIHGDIVHSRPLTISYGPKSSGGTEFRIFYGANDGLFRAVNPDNGREDWAFIAPEHLAGIERLYANTPTVDFYGLDAALSSAIDAEPKDYFFDGATGAHTEYNTSDQLTTGYIFPTMRRGGGMVYAFNVSPSSLGIPPSTPTFMWKKGCDGGSCDTGYANLGQTWSTPISGFVEGYNSGGSPVLFMGGGWDECLDTDAANISCTSGDSGNSVFVIDATTGAVLQELATDAPVVAEVEPLDIDFDGAIDFVYAADASGALYRISFASLDSETALATVALSSGSWTIKKIAETSGADKRFMNRPVVGAVGNKVFVTIGSGDRERPLKVNYPYTSDIDNRFYAFVDRPYPWDENNDGTLQTAEATISLRPTADLDGSTMLDAATGLATGETILDFDGWYLDLPDTGEQVVNQSAIGGGAVYFNSFQPVGNSQGACAELGTSKAYSIPLFDPVYDSGTIFGQGIPIPPIIVTVDLGSGDDSCSGGPCGDGELDDETVTVCIGCQGFKPLEIVPSGTGRAREAYRAENIDRL